MQDSLERHIPPGDVELASSRFEHMSPSLPTSTSSSRDPTPPAAGDTLQSSLMSSRPSLPTSLSDFALPLSGSNSPSSSVGAVQSNIGMSKDDSAPIMRRPRRPTLMNWLTDARLISPLTSTIIIPSPLSAKGKERAVERNVDLYTADETDSFRDKDRMLTDSSSPSSESDIQTPPLRIGNGQTDDLSDRPKSSPMDISRSASPASALKPAADIQDSPGPSRIQKRRLSLPPKPARLISILAETRPDEADIKSEAQFQRLVASFSGLPPGLGQNRTSRVPSDRGRYPEEAGDDDEFQKEETPSDDGNIEDALADEHPTYSARSGSDPMNIGKPMIPGTGSGSNGTLDDFSGTISASPGNGSMDVDIPFTFGSLPSNGIIPPPPQWRQTPPPSTAAVRTGKRKYEDRFEPYAPSSKRRAVSPSLTPFSHSHVAPIIIPRSPVLKARGSISYSQANSATSSPTISQSSSMYAVNNTSTFSLSQGSITGGNGIGGHHRSGSSSSVVSSPTVRASMILASPILRPVPRLATAGKRGLGDVDGEKIVDGTGEGFGSLSLGH